MTPVPPPPSARASVDAKVRKFPCASCGADVVWNPGASALKCPFCGAEKKLPTTADAVREHPIDEALSAPRDLGWGALRKAVKCSRCGATTTLDPGVAASACAFCGTPAVVEAPVSGTMVRPEGLLPFRLDRDGAVGRFREWISGLWFRPNDLKSKSSVASLSGVYVPFWTFDAATHSLWSADAGYYYQVPVEVVENGQSVTRMETRTRWEPAEGVLEKFFDDLPVQASRGLPPELARSIEPFPTDGLVPYEPAYLSGFLAEEYAVDVKEALGMARRRMHAEIQQACASEVPGDTHRNLSVQSVFSGIAYKNALLPIWIAAYQYGGAPYRFLVNGITGKVAGKAPYSWIKVGLAILAALALVALIASQSR
jgi:DNA-directed RNA polymerase subunit RPC12/RpoP